VYLLDTNIVSEIVKPIPDGVVMTKLTAQRPDRLFASEMTRFELREGALRRADAAALWERIQAQVLPLVNWLPVTRPIAETAGEIAASLRKMGRPPKGPVDPLLAATASVHGLTLVTRNVRDFEYVPHLVIENWFVEA
jgi:predicted nucleic acid-binding protein